MILSFFSFLALVLFIGDKRNSSWTWEQILTTKFYLQNFLRIYWIYFINMEVLLIGCPVPCAVSPNSGIYINLNWLFYSYYPFWIWFRLWRYHFWETLKNNESNRSNIVIPDPVLDSLLFTRERCKTFGSTR